MPSVSLKQGTITYQQWGPAEGRPIVFIHGYGMGGSLWRALAERLAARGFLCVAPTWPLGAHVQPMRPEAELTMEGIAEMVDELVETLSLDDVVLVGNDTGGAIAQIVASAATRGLGALVLTSCDAFEHFPPPILKPFIRAARFRPAFRAALLPLRTGFGRKRAYGKLAHADIDALVAEWVKPPLTDAKIREDLRRFTASLNRQTMIRAGAALPRFTKPALIAWSQDDAFFPLGDGQRLATAFSNSSLELVARSRTFSMIDQPDRLGELIADFAGRSTGRSPASPGREPAGTTREEEQ